MADSLAMVVPMPVEDIFKKSSRYLMKRNKFIIIGLGNIGQEILEKLSKDIEVVCIDQDRECEEVAKKIRGDIHVITGDATSRLVLEEAGAADADGIIITIATEKVNIETARILREHFNAKRIISIVTTKEGIETLESLEVEVVNIFSASATVIRNKLEQTSRTAHAIGLGKDEILEVEVHPHSRLANRPLRKLTPVRWRIGIIYRDENIIIPRYDTVLKARDRVIILGDPSVLKTVAEILTFKFQHFPLEYGSTAVTYLTGNEEEVFFNELDYLFSILPMNRIILIYSQKASDKKDMYEQYIRKDNIKNYEIKETILAPLAAVQSVIDGLKGSHGLIVIPRAMLFDSINSLVFDARKKAFIKNLLRLSLCPVFLSGGTFPYEKAAVPCVEEINIQHSLETSLEIAAALNNEVAALLVKPSKYISDDEDVKTFDEMKKTVNDISLMYKFSINAHILNGNPVKSITDSLKNYNLLIADIGGWKSRWWFAPFINPDVLWHIMKKTNISTLLLPHVEEAL
jgi:hypothetical protein